MINVFYWPRDQRIVIQGHAHQRGANYSPVVCGAASALFYSLLSASNGFLKYKWVKGRFYLDKRGIGYCKLWPKRRYFKHTRVAIGTCVGGLLMLADKYPHLVKVTVATGIPFDDKDVLEEAQQGGVSYLQKFVYDNTRDRPPEQQEDGEKQQQTAETKRSRKGRKGVKHENRNG